MYNIALIGAGNWGKNYIKVIQENKEIFFSWIYTKDSKIDIDGVNHTHDYNDILEDSAVDAVIISTPAETHYELSKIFLGAGKDILVEKPLAKNSGEARDLFNIAKRLGRIIIPGHIFLYHPLIKDLKKLVNNQSIHSLHFKRLSNYNFRNPLWEMAIHDVYLIQYLLDAKIDDFEIINRVSSKYHEFISFMVKDKEINLEVSTSYPKKIREIIGIGYDCNFIFEDKSIIVQHNSFIRSVINSEDNENSLTNQLNFFINSMKNRNALDLSSIETIKILEKIESFNNSKL